MKEYSEDELISLMQDEKLEIWEPILIPAGSVDRDDVDEWELGRVSEPEYIYYLMPQGRELHAFNLMERLNEVDTVINNVSPLGLRALARDLAQVDDRSLIVAYRVHRCEGNPFSNTILITIEYDPESYTYRYHTPWGVMSREIFELPPSVVSTTHAFRQTKTDGRAVANLASLADLQLSGHDRSIVFVDMSGHTTRFWSYEDDGFDAYTHLDTKFMKMIDWLSTKDCRFEEHVGKMLLIPLGTKVYVACVRADTRSFYQLFVSKSKDANYLLMPLNRRQKTELNLTRIRSLWRRATQVSEQAPDELQLIYPDNDRIQALFAQPPDQDVQVAMMDALLKPETYAPGRSQMLARWFSSMHQAYTWVIGYDRATSMTYIYGLSRDLPLIMPETTARILSLVVLGDGDMDLDRRTGLTWTLLRIAPNHPNVVQPSRDYYLHFETYQLPPCKRIDQMRMSAAWFATHGHQIVDLTPVLTVTALRFMMLMDALLKIQNPSRSPKRILLRTDAINDVDLWTSVAQDVSIRYQTDSSLEPWLSTGHLLYIAHRGWIDQGFLFLANFGQGVMQIMGHVTPEDGYSLPPRHDNEELVTTDSAAMLDWVQARIKREIGMMHLEDAIMNAIHMNGFQ